MSDEKVTYASYLKLRENPNKESNSGLLDCLKPLSKVKEENLFIVTHQAFELWFQIILIDLDDICAKLGGDGSKCLLSVETSCRRICLTLQLVVQHFAIIETMSPMTFLEFRPLLKSGSGFQSEQFRLIENKIGIKSEGRVKNCDKDYKTYFEDDESGRLKKSEDDAKERSLLMAVQRWLETIIEEVEKDNWPFWEFFNKGWKEWIEELNPDRDRNEEQKKQFESLQNSFKTISTEEEYKKYESRRLSFKAFQGAMLVSLYRNEDRFQLPYQIITELKDIEKLVYNWRTTHVMMVHRMIGNKQGTGKSSGVDYLKSTTASASYNVFLDLYNTATYIIPMEYLPPFLKTLA